MTPASRSRGLVKRFGGLTATDRVDLTLRAGRGARGDRPQRRRQDHADQPARPASCARRGPHPVRRPATITRLAGPAGARCWARPLLPDHVGVRGVHACCENVMLAVQARARPQLPLLAPARCASRRCVDAAHEALDAVGLARAGRRRRSPRSRTASAASSSWRWRWRRAPQLLLLDEPMAGMSLRRVGAHGGAAAVAQGPLHASCWSSTTWTPCSRWPTASRCWSTAS